MHTALLLEMAAEGLGSRVALGSSNSGVTFAKLLDRARHVSLQITQSGCSRVAYVGLNSEAFPIALFAAGLAGRPFAPLNYRLPDADLRAILARTAPSLVIADDELLHRVSGIEGVQIVARSSFVRDSEPFAAGDPAAGVAAATEPEDIAVLLFTSGTTGEPKAAVLRHRHLTAYVVSTVEFMASGAHECALISVPPYHIAAVSAALTSTFAGRRMVHLEAFSAEEWVRTAAEEHVTHAMVVPTMLGRILDCMESGNQLLPDLRHLSYGGGRMPVQTIERALRLLPKVDFVNAYGLTETSSTICMLTPEDHRIAAASEDARVRARLASVGRPLPTIELNVRDPDGRPVPLGIEGEIWVRGEQVSGEYLNKKTVSADGWFPTQDCGSLDEGGFLFLAGRLDDVIVRGGENISPGEIEDVLRTHPTVQDVAVIGLPDTEWGERIVAVVVSRATDRTDAQVDALRQFVRERLRSTKTPGEIVFRAQLPYTETGKLLRRALKKELASAPGGR
ncbi:MAG TPA: class I adenylate-forming enzyme family protein [Steroidobacteraceae bacterium]|nr:class I adenylate-forming enzyme family protein [Steroidobacteraceae bacterium]